MKFLILGSTGMAGHMITIYLTEKGHDVTSLSRRKLLGYKTIVLNVFVKNEIEHVIIDGKYDVIVNCMGILNAEAEHNKPDSVYLNAFLPHYVASIIDGSNTRLIHLSTDCVFKGDKGMYKEQDIKDGISFYSCSKSLGEVMDNKNLTIRTSIIGPDLDKDGEGLLNWFMQANMSIYGYKNAIWTGITTLELAKAIEAVSLENIKGIYHLVNDECISKYELLTLLNLYYRNNSITINENIEQKSNKSLIDSRKEIKYKIKDYSEMLIELKIWIIDHKNIYPNYYKMEREYER